MPEYKMLSVKPSPKKGKKYVAVFQHKKTGRKKQVHFGAEGMKDYTQHKDKERRKRYRSRHAKDLKGDPTRAGYLSYYILWGNSTSFRTNALNFKKRFKF